MSGKTSSKSKKKKKENKKFVSGNFFVNVVPESRCVSKRVFPIPQLAFFSPNNEKSEKIPEKKKAKIHRNDEMATRQKGVFGLKCDKWCQEIKRRG